MIRLKDLLPMSYAGRFAIKNDDENGLTVWEGQKFGKGYDEMRNEYGDYEVCGIRSANGRYLIITIQKESWL